MMSKYARERIGFGIGFEPFKWRRFGYVNFGGSSHWLNIGPFFIQWAWPTRADK